MKKRTFMMLKPDAFTSKADEAIISELQKHGFIIESSKRMVVSMEIMKTLLTHYEEVIDRMEPSFNFPGKLFNTFYYGDNKEIMPMIVTYDQANIIEESRKLVGATNPSKADPGSIRGMFSKDNYETAEKENRLVNNLIHASDSEESAIRELEIWHRYF